MRYPFDDQRIPEDQRNFENYYADRLFSMDTLVVSLIETVDKAVPEGSLFTLLETMAMAHSAASERMGEVEEYIRNLEARLALVVTQEVVSQGDPV